jgi:hypothetical protein
MNSYRLEQPVCKLQTILLRMNSKTAANISLNEILKKGALVVNQSAVHLMKCVQVQFFATIFSGRNLFYLLQKIASTVVLRIPLFKNFVKPFSVSCKATATKYKDRNLCADMQ